MKYSNERENGIMKYRRVIWQCNSKFKDQTRCQTPHLTVNAKDDIVFTLTSGMEINA